MTAPTRTRPPNVVGGLEVRRSHNGSWLIRLSDGTDLHELTQPRKRNATAVRALLLGAVPDWSQVTAKGWPDEVTADQRAAASRIVHMASLVAARASRGALLCCGCRESMCACGTGQHPDGPHYTAEELAWTR